MHIVNKHIFNVYFDSLIKRFEKLHFQVRQQNKFRAIRITYSTFRFLSIYYLIRLKKDEKIIITGCGRSATQFTSKLFNELGVKLGHERLERNGIVSWTLAPDTYTKVWGPSFNSIKHAKMPIVHQVRHPLDVISSTITVFSDKKSWDFISQFIPIMEYEPPILKAMKYWFYWNILAEKKSIHSYRVENIENELDTLIKIGGFKIKADKASVLRSISTATHSRKHSNLSWEDLKKEDIVLTEKIIELSKKYGYKP